jgi:excisionase family DNA binding protein
VIAPLVLSRRQAAKLLRIDRGATLDALIRAGKLREIPWGAGRRIPLAEVEKLAREGFTVTGRAPRTRRAPGTCDADALRKMDLGDL